MSNPEALPDRERPLVIQPLPWTPEHRTSGMHVINDANGITVCTGLSKDEAELICRSVNVSAVRADAERLTEKNRAEIFRRIDKAILESLPDSDPFDGVGSKVFWRGYNFASALYTRAVIAVRERLTCASCGAPAHRGAGKQSLDSLLPDWVSKALEEGSEAGDGNQLPSGLREDPAVPGTVNAPNATHSESAHRDARLAAIVPYAQHKLECASNRCETCNHRGHWLDGALRCTGCPVFKQQECTCGLGALLPPKDGTP